MSFLNYCIICNIKPIPTNPIDIYKELLKFKSTIFDSTFNNEVNCEKPIDQDMEN